MAVAESQALKLNSVCLGLQMFTIGAITTGVTILLRLTTYKGSTA